MFCTQCGTSNSQTARFCVQCGAALAGNAATIVGAPPITPGTVVTPHHASNPAVLAAGTPAAAPRLRREGSLLVVPRDAKLPPYCVKCGQPAEKYIRKTFGWHQPWLYLLIFLGVLLYAIVATIVMKRQRVEVPLCATHRKRRTGFLLAGWLLLAGFIPLGVIVGSLGPGDDMAGVGFLVGFVAFIASLVFFVLGARLLVPKNIDDYQATFAGASPVFLQYAEAQPVAASVGR